MVPSGALAPSKAACLAAVLHGATTVTGVVELTGVSRQICWHRLRQLDAEGLIGFPQRTPGGIHPKIRIVAVAP